MNKCNCCGKQFDNVHLCNVIIKLFYVDHVNKKYLSIQFNRLPHGFKLKEGESFL